MASINYQGNFLGELLNPTDSQVGNAWLPFVGRFEFRIFHFFFCCLTILMLSAVDTYLVYRYQDVIIYEEKNPICLYLINCDQDSLGFFAIGKIIGNVCAISTMVAIYVWRKEIGIVVVQAITAFQIGLIGYQFLS